jgi:hypothetical protein
MQEVTFSESVIKVCDHKAVDYMQNTYKSVTCGCFHLFNHLTIPSYQAARLPETLSFGMTWKMSVS